MAAARNCTRDCTRDDNRDGSTDPRRSRPLGQALQYVSHFEPTGAGLSRGVRLMALLLLAGAAATVAARSPESSPGSPPAYVPGVTYGYGGARPVPEQDRYFVPPSPLLPSPLLPQYDRPPQLQTRPGDAFPDPPRAYPTPPRHYPTPPRDWPQNNQRSSRP